MLLGAPTLRLRGDYLALVTLGFGEVDHASRIKNLDEITAGTQGLSPIPPPGRPTPTSACDWADRTTGRSTTCTLGS